MTVTRYRIHPSRVCANCAHHDPQTGCLQLVSIVGPTPFPPPDFGCHEHQTESEHRLDLHRFAQPFLRGVEQVGRDAR